MHSDLCAFFFPRGSDRCGRLKLGTDKSKEAVQERGEKEREEEEEKKDKETERKKVSKEAEDGYDCLIGEMNSRSEYGRKKASSVARTLRCRASCLDRLIHAVAVQGEWTYGWQVLGLSVREAYAPQWLRDPFLCIRARHSPAWYPTVMLPPSQQ